MLMERRSKHLFLLVGSNPLPVFVSASLLSEPQGTIYFIHTIDTYYYAKQLSALLTKSSGYLPAQFRFFELTSPADQFKIHQDLAKHLSNAKFSAGETVGFNYTGGMKSMSVHAYEFFKEWCQKKYFRFTFSYLDPLESCLRFANGESYSPSGQDCSLTLSELLALHGRKITDQEPKAFFPAVSTLLANIAAESSGVLNMKAWNNKFLKGITKQQFEAYLRNFYSPEGFEQSRLFPSFEVLENFLRKSFQNTSLAVSDNAFLTSGNNQLPSVPVLGQLALAFVDTERPNITRWTLDSLSDRLVKYLDGGWLENYVLSCLEAISDQCGIHERILNFHFNKPAATVDPPEFDVAAMQGYRLFAFSCTVSAEKEKAKLKLFEAYVRARQIGGDEAKVALVSGYPQPQKLFEEISEAWMESRNKIKIFGPQHLRNLETHLKDWFLANE